jgi:hypothetical protein
MNTFRRVDVQNITLINFKRAFEVEAVTIQVCIVGRSYKFENFRFEVIFLQTINIIDITITFYVYKNKFYFCSIS